MQLYFRPYYTCRFLHIYKYIITENKHSEKGGFNFKVYDKNMMQFCITTNSSALCPYFFLEDNITLTVNS